MASEGCGIPVIHIVDDDLSVLTALSKTLTSAGFRCRSHESGEQFLSAAVGLRDCVVVDVHLPDMNGIDLLNALRARGHVVPVLVITGFASIELAVQAMKTGALDFLAKPFNSTDLIEKVASCLAVGRLRVAERERHCSAVTKLSALTERELEILGKVIGGRTNKAIADILRISVKTVEAHRARIMEKTGALSLVDLTRLWDAAGYAAPADAPAGAVDRRLEIAL